jgi:hypothetical protein
MASSILALVATVHSTVPAARPLAVSSQISIEPPTVPRLRRSQRTLCNRAGGERLANDVEWPAPAFEDDTGGKWVPTFRRIMVAPDGLRRARRDLRLGDCNLSCHRLRRSLPEIGAESRMINPSDGLGYRIVEATGVVGRLYVGTG